MGARAAFVDEYAIPALGALAVHLAIGALVVLTVSFSAAPVGRGGDEPEIIEAEMVDGEALEREAERRRLLEEEAARRVVEERLAAEQAAREEQERQEQAARDAAAAEQARAEAEAKRVAEAQARAEAERRAKFEAERKERERVATERRERAAQRRREAELKEQLELEERRRAAERAGLMDQYKLAIQQKVMRAWVKPSSAGVGLDCEVRVEQIRGGEVVRVNVARCNGDEAVVRSIETAVWKASPLPAPPDAALFERQIIFDFRPGR